MAATVGDLGLFTMADASQVPCVIVKDNGDGTGHVRLFDRSATVVQDVTFADTDKWNPKESAGGMTQAQALARGLGA